MKTRSLLFLSLVSLGCEMAPEEAGNETADGRLVYRQDGKVERTSIPSTGRVPEGCTRIEGGQVGQAGLVITLGNGVSVTFKDWVLKDGEAEEIGFGYLTSGGTAAFAVKAGGETHYGSTSPWTHPGGTGGPNAPGISNITFCPERPNGGTGTGGAMGTGGPIGAGGSTGTGGATGTGGSFIVD